MSVLDDLQKLSAAEEFFDKLGVDYDPAVVQVARLHILRRMGQYLANTDFSGSSEEETRDSCGKFLAQAYQDFVVSSPIQERLFKVHKDAVKPKEEPPKPFVALSSLSVGSAKDMNKDLGTSS